MSLGCSGEHVIAYLRFLPCFPETAIQNEATTSIELHGSALEAEEAEKNIRHSQCDSATVRQLIYIPPSIRFSP